MVHSQVIQNATTKFFVALKNYFGGGSSLLTKRMEKYKFFKNLQSSHRACNIAVDSKAKTELRSKIYVRHGARQCIQEQAHKWKGRPSQQMRAQEISTSYSIFSIFRRYRNNPLIYRLKLPSSVAPGPLDGRDLQ